MQTVSLADTGRVTTRLGYGCSSIMGGMGRRASLRVLELAYDAGVRHFDVAPSYGFGEAERCLGEFAAGHKGMVTLTTKFGILPPKRSGLMGTARAIAGPLLKVLPGLKARAQKSASLLTKAAPPRDLSAERAWASLHNSLRELRTERIDLFLLHDATPEEVKENTPLLDMLQRAKAEGKIGAFGVGTDPGYASTIAAETPRLADVVQMEWSVFDEVPPPGPFRVHHRSLSHNRQRLAKYLASADDTVQRWSKEVGADLKEPGTLSELMMRAALRANASGIVLFSSKSEAHIRANAAISEPSALDGAADALHRLVRREAAGIPR